MDVRLMIYAELKCKIFVHFDMSLLLFRGGVLMLAVLEKAGVAKPQNCNEYRRDGTTSTI